MSGAPMRVSDLAGTSARFPRAIELRTESRTLVVQWQDGTTTAWAHDILRENCRCAVCEAQRRRGVASVAGAGVSITDVEPYGPGALRMIFNDGHTRGIYPYAYLMRLPALADLAV
jgi:DUF971 family protein